MKQAISDIILCAAALAAAICGLWLEGRGSAAGWPLAVAAALLAVLSPAVTGAGRTRIASVMEAVLVLFVSGGFLAYAERLGERLGLNAYSALSAAAALFALHELSAWWHCDGRLMLARNDGHRPPTLLLQLALTALLLGAAAAYVATTRTDAMALAYAATMAAMAVGMTALAAMPRRLGPEMRRELRVGLADVALALAAGYGAAWLGGRERLAPACAPAAVASRLPRKGGIGCEKRLQQPCGDAAAGCLRSETARLAARNRPSGTARRAVLHCKAATSARSCGPGGCAGRHWREIILHESGIRYIHPGMSPATRRDAIHRRLQMHCLVPYA